MIEAPANQTPLTQNYTKEALAFIEKNKDKPFFVYLPHTMVHLPLQASENSRPQPAQNRASARFSRRQSGQVVGNPVKA